MKQLVKWEFKRSFISPKFAIFFSFMMVAALFYMVVGVFDQYRSGVEFLLFSLSQLSSLVYLLGSVAAGMMITQCFAERSVQLNIMAGYSRLEVLISKFLSYMLFIFVLLGVPVMTVTLLATLLWGWGDSATGTYVALFLAVVVSNMALMSICIPISFAVKSLGASIGVNCAVVIILYGAVQGGLTAQIGLEDILSFTPAGQSLLLYTDMSAGNVSKAVTVAIITVILMFIITYHTFKKEELK